jgi:hypothetical protein
MAVIVITQTPKEPPEPHPIIMLGASGGKEK